MNPTTAKKILRDVGDDRAFHVYMGASLHSLYELANELEVMSDESFRHHTTGKNDFSSWVKAVFADEKLASRIEKASKKNMAKIVGKRIKELEAVMNIDRHTSREILLRGVVDFAIGLVIGVVLGIVLRSLF